MSKKFYVLFSIKELVQPRIIKSKTTINKYLKENKSMDFRQFGTELEAQRFAKDVELQVKQKYG
jgi:hypothetical protein